MSPTGSRRPHLQSHTFLNLYINNMFICKWSNTHSILVGTLLAILRKHLLMQQGVPANLVNIINGLESTPDLITVATIRIPSFGDDIWNPVNGFCTMGQLSSIHIQKSIPSYALYVGQELLLVAGNHNNPITDDFVQTYIRTLGRNNSNPFQHYFHQHINHMFMCLPVVKPCNWPPFILDPPDLVVRPYHLLPAHQVEVYRGLEIYRPILLEQVRWDSIWPVSNLIVL